MGRSIEPYMYIGTSNYIKTFYFQLDFLYVPFFVFGLLKFISLLKDGVVKKYIKKMLIGLGKMSMLMWFIHCVFFNMCKNTFQPILYLFRFSSIVTVIWGILLCYLIAYIFHFPIDKLIRAKNKYIFKI